MKPYKFMKSLKKKIVCSYICASPTVIKELERLWSKRFSRDGSDWSLVDLDVGLHEMKHWEDGLIGANIDEIWSD